MVQLYAMKGLPEHHARNAIGAMATTPEFFTDVMMMEELQMAPPPAISPLAAGARIGGGMLVGGCAPLLAAALLGGTIGGNGFFVTAPAYLLVLCVAAVALGALGYARAAITHQQKQKLALQTLALALPAVCLARLAGTYMLPVGLGATA